MPPIQRGLVNQCVNDTMMGQQRDDCTKQPHQSFASLQELHRIYAFICNRYIRETLMLSLNAVIYFSPNIHTLTLLRYDITVQVDVVESKLWRPTVYVLVEVAKRPLSHACAITTGPKTA